MSQSFVDIVGGATVNLTGITGYCVATPILVVHESVLSISFLLVELLVRLVEEPPGCSVGPTGQIHQGNYCFC
jgi:hypothetical protein